MFKSIKLFFLDMVKDTSGHVNSKIVMGILSFIVASILAFIGADNIYVGMFLTYSAGSFGFSCFDNKSAFQFKNIETKTTTETITKDTDVKVDVANIVNNTVDKFTDKNNE